MQDESYRRHSIRVVPPEGKTMWSLGEVVGMTSWDPYKLRVEVDNRCGWGKIALETDIVTKLIALEATEEQGVIGKLISDATVVRKTGILRQLGDVVDLIIPHSINVEDQLRFRCSIQSPPVN